MQATLIQRKVRELGAVARYGVMTRAQIQDVAEVRNDRQVRADLMELVGDGLLARASMEVVHPRAGRPAPVYFPTSRGVEIAAEAFDEPRFLATSTQRPNMAHLFHFTQVTDVRILLDRAIAGQSLVSLGGSLAEWDLANTHEKDARDPHKKYRLYTLLTEKPRLVCAPDAAFLLVVQEYRKVYYVEIDRGSSGIRQIAASKTPGYAELARRQWHQRHFETNVDTFSVLHVCPSASRRDLLRNEIKSKDGAGLHRFVSWIDCEPARLLHDPIFWTCNETEPQPLVKQAVGATS